MSKRIDKRLWGVLGKQQTYYSPQQFLQGKTKVPLNANPFDSWDAKRSRFNRVDGYENAVQQGGVVPQGTAVPVSPTPTPSITPSATPTYTPTNTPNPTSTTTSTPSPTATEPYDIYLFQECNIPSNKFRFENIPGILNVGEVYRITGTTNDSRWNAVLSSWEDETMQWQNSNSVVDIYASVIPYSATGLVYSATGISFILQPNCPGITPTPTASNSPTPSITPSNTPSGTPTSTPTNTPTNTQTNTPTNTQTNTPTTSPSNTPSGTPTSTPTNTPTNTNTPSGTPTNTPTNTTTTSPTPSSTPAPFSPSGITNLQYWFMGASGSSVSSWTNYGLLGGTINQGIAARQPLVLTADTLGSYSGRALTYFDRDFQNNTFSNINISASTIFFVGKFQNAGQQNGIYAVSGLPVSVAAFEYQNYASTYRIGLKPNLYQIGSSSAITLDNIPQILVSSGDASNFNAQILTGSGVFAPTGSPFTNATSVSALQFGLDAGLSGGSDLTIHEFIIYNRKLTSTEFNDCINYLKTKYQFSSW